MPVWLCSTLEKTEMLSQNSIDFAQPMEAQVVSCVLLEMSLAFLGILCNLLVVTTIRHQVIFLFWSRILLTMIMIRNQEFAVYGEKPQEELQNSTTNLLLINLCFSNLLVSFLVTQLFFLKWNRDQFRSIWKYLKFIEMEKGISSEILSVGKAKAEKGSINQSIGIAKQTHFLEIFCWVVVTQSYLWLGYVFPAGYGAPISSHFSADSNKIFLFDKYIEDLKTTRWSQSLPSTRATPFQPGVGRSIGQEQWFVENVKKNSWQVGIRIEGWKKLSTVYS